MRGFIFITQVVDPEHPALGAGGCDTAPNAARNPIGRRQQ
jgi:hypothetical protein